MLGQRLTESGGKMLCSAQCAQADADKSGRSEQGSFERAAPDRALLSLQRPPLKMGTVSGLLPVVVFSAILVQHCSAGGYVKKATSLSGDTQFGFNFSVK